MVEPVNTQLNLLTINDWIASKIFFDEELKREAIRVNKKIMITEPIKTGGWVFLKKSKGLVLILKLIYNHNFPQKR